MLRPRTSTRRYIMFAPLHLFPVRFVNLHFYNAGVQFHLITFCNKSYC